MDEKEIVTTETPAEEFDPVKEIEKLKQTMVSKDEYDKIVAERNKYCKALIDGTSIESEAKKEPVDINKLRNDLFTKDLSNLEFVEKALTLRNEIIEEKGEDIFVGSGSKLTPTQEDYLVAQKVADGMQSCIDVANGNSEIFTRELMRITKDVTLPGAINPKIKRRI